MDGLKAFDELLYVYDEYISKSCNSKKKVYKFEKHKGYGTAEHIALLKQYAPSPIHRKTFITHFVDID